MRTPREKTSGPGFGLLALLLVGVLSLLLGGGWMPGRTLFSNDGPLGRLVSECHQLPGRFFGCWQDLNSVGYREGAAVPNVSYGLQWLLGPVWFSKLYAPLALLLLGVSAWFLFRRWRLAPTACLLGALAATLNSTFFSATCWGVAAHAITVGMSFLALGLLAEEAAPYRWLRVALAGLALGMGVAEGADIGAFFSLLVAAFAIYQAWVMEAPRVGAIPTLTAVGGCQTRVMGMPSLRHLGDGLARVALLGLCAAALAASSVAELLVTNVEGVVATDSEDTRSEPARWDWATQWSLPKAEALGLVVPGLFGYLLNTPEGGSYWGAIGRHPSWDRYLASARQGPPPQAFLRYVGGGSYVGIPVVLVALWAVMQSFRREPPGLGLSRRLLIWFWLGAGVISLLLAFGRFAPFYRMLYALPYFSTIRNPVKFLHVFSLATVALFALGVDDLWRGFLQPATESGSSRWRGLRNWYVNAGRPERFWVQGCVAALGISLAGWIGYGLCRQSLEQHLQTIQFTPPLASLIAAFSIRQVGWFPLFFAESAGLMTLMFAGAFAGPRAGLGMGLLGVLVALDLGRADLPWIQLRNYQEQYASNPVIDRLRDQPYEHRVSNFPREFLTPEFQRRFGESNEMASDEQVFSQLYQIEWAQHLFPYYNIQSLDIVQLSRKPADLKAFEDAFTPHSPGDYSRLFSRYWQLSNTRYLVGDASFLTFLNRKLDPERQRFRIRDRFDLKTKSGAPHPRDWSDFSTEFATNGDYAVFEFTGALPRAKLYANWQVNLNDEDALRHLSDPAHNPEQTVLVAGGLPANARPGSGDAAVGSVTFASYAPKDIVLKAAPDAPSVLLLNDRFDPGWSVCVDGQPRPLLRCNYLMRGVYLPAGPHIVEFRFQPPHSALSISLAALAVGVALLGFILWVDLRGERVLPLGAVPSPWRETSPKPAPQASLESSAADT